MKKSVIIFLFLVMNSALLCQIEILKQSDEYAAYYTAKVIDSSGIPILGTLITADGVDSIYNEQSGKFLLGFLSSAFSDSLTIHPLINFSNPYFQEYSRRISISKGDSIIDSDVILRLPVVTGRVYYGNKETHPRIEILFYGLREGGSSWAYPDSNGYYSIRVSPEPYYILCTINYNILNYITQRKKYFNNKPNLSKADILIINKDTSGINFNFPTLQVGSISGKVRDAVSQQPLSNAWITVASDAPIDTNFVKTDQDGNYTIQVLEDDYFLSVFKEGYFQQLYKNAIYGFDATPVNVDSNNLNVTGINFDLIKEEIGSNGIVGFVKDYSSGEKLQNVNVYAIPISGGFGHETFSDVNGRYELNPMVNGDYILLFSKDGYISEYYNDIYKWEDAFVFKLSGDKYISADDVILTQMNSFGGEILGKISSNSDSALSGSLISAISPLDSVISTSLSSFDGSYRIPSLTDGDYSIIASKIGYKTSEYFNKINIDINSQPVVDSVNIIISITGLKEKVNISPSSFKLFQNYPNPFNPSTTIKYELPKESQVQLAIYNILGQKVAELVNTIQKAGRHEVKWNAGDFASGIYIYQMKAENYISSKKLILLK